MRTDSNARPKDGALARRFAALAVAMLGVLVLHSPLLGESVLMGQTAEAYVGIDFEIYRQAGLRYALGDTVYSDPLFIYPPGFAWVMAKALTVSADIHAAYRALSRAFFVLVPVLLLWPHRRWFGSIRPLYALFTGLLVVSACGFWDAFRASYGMVNFDHTVFVTLLLALVVAHHGARFAAGLMVGVIGALKLTPLMVLGVFGAALVAALVRRERPLPEVVHVVAGGVLGSALMTAPFVGLLPEFFAHYGHVEMGGRTFSIASALGHWDLLLVWGPRVNQLLAVALGFVAGWRLRRHPASLWGVGFLLVFLANPRGQSYTLCYLAPVAAGLAVRATHGWRSAASGGSDRDRASSAFAAGPARDAVLAGALVLALFASEAAFAGVAFVAAALFINGAVIAVIAAEAASASRLGNSPLCARYRSSEPTAA